MRQESTSDLRADDITANRQEPPISSRSYTAMVLSAFLPGLGQLYLGNFLKGFVILFVFVSAIGIFYLNSYPVNEWGDLLRFRTTSQAETAAKDKTNTETGSDDSIPIWTLDNGETLMFKPSWILKVTSSIQAIICWIYAVSDGLRGRRKIVMSSHEID